MPNMTRKQLDMRVEDLRDELRMSGIQFERFRIGPRQGYIMFTVEGTLPQDDDAIKLALGRVFPVSAFASVASGEHEYAGEDNHHVQGRVKVYLNADAER